ncbi:hypothetical protein [Aquimarina sediminis]|uniref:hypothetical protein n=1 Tax=Aquimarina sediminis TaxID=2070536 RepID=UPI000CA0678A|nr:hypothetical protein [Aquimarina sediminis]
MENKDRYLNALIENNGKLNEIDLGQRIGLNDNETREIITQLLSEYKIEYSEYKNCDYNIMKKGKNNNK